MWLPLIAWDMMAVASLEAVMLGSLSTAEAPGAAMTSAAVVAVVAIVGSIGHVCGHRLRLRLGSVALQVRRVIEALENLKEVVICVHKIMLIVAEDHRVKIRALPGMFSESVHNSFRRNLRRFSRWKVVDPRSAKEYKQIHIIPIHRQITRASLQRLALSSVALGRIALLGRVASL